MVNTLTLVVFVRLRHASLLLDWLLIASFFLVVVHDVVYGCGHILIVFASLEVCVKIKTHSLFVCI